LTAGIDDADAPMTEPVLRIDPTPQGVWTLWLNRPQVRNAMSLALVDALIAAVDEAERDGARVLVLRGSGGHFCAGADIADMAAARTRLAENPQAIAEVNARFGALCGAFHATGLATVAVLEGAVMGGGLGLACAVDVVLADRTARLRLPETGLGLVPAQIAPWLVERLGPSQARRLVVTGASLDAEAALALGLVHELHPDTAALEAAVVATVQQILRGAPGAIAASKALLRRARFEPAEALVDAAAQIFSDAALGPEGAEGTLAFLQKRPPRWAPSADTAT
jgi:isohexenylglutaconyl-CoA hydratase